MTMASSEATPPAAPVEHKLTAQVETTEHMYRYNEDYRKDMMETHLGRAIIAHSQAHAAFREELKSKPWDPRAKMDPFELGAQLDVSEHQIQQGSQLPGQIDFSPMIIPARDVELVGAMLANEKMVTIPETDLYASTLGKSEKTARGRRGQNSRTGRLSKLKLTLQEEYETADELDLNFREDSQPATLPFFWRELGRTHMRDRSQRYIDWIVGVGTGTGTYTDPSGNAHSRGAFTKGGITKTPDGLIDIRAACVAENFTPDCLMIHNDVYHALLKSDDFKDRDVFREYANYSDGMLTKFMGMTIFPTNQITGTADKSKGWAFKKEYFLHVALRRNALVNTWRVPGKTGAEGMSISSRHGAAILDPTRCLVATFV